MPALVLKTYQSQALNSLQRFLGAAQNSGSLAAAWALEMQRQAGELTDPNTLPGASLAGAATRPTAAWPPYAAQPFGDTPCVCLRIPTGGGKTLLAAHAIPLLARTWRQVDFPLALWLVPSTTIREQTLLALQQPGHAYRAALEAAYGQALVVLDLDAAPTLAAQDIGRKAVVLVATMQSFRVRHTQGRNVYAFSEEFDPHFAQFQALGALDGPSAVALDRVTQADLDEIGQRVLGAADLGRVKHSLANLLALARPIVVVDEAHNAKTDTTFETLKRVAPSVILELTATPVSKKTNVLYSVSARELQAEDMVKLPVMLAEHKAWPDAVRDAVLRRRHLEAESLVEAAQGGRYVRPIVLFQAQDKNGDVPPAALRQHLLDERLVEDEREIVIATGDQRGLDGLDLFDPACPVRFVITVEALKEGWDCSFAYVLCSLQNVRSGKDVEQLLGRVLRMPYATRRKAPALNRAYAHVVARSFSEAATALVDRMVQGMGFEALDAATAVLADDGLPDLFGDPALMLPAPRPSVLTLSISTQAAAALQGEHDVQVTQQADPGAALPATLVVIGEMSDALLGRVLAQLPAADHAAVTTQVLQHNQRVGAALAPAMRGVLFAPLPRLCVGQHSDHGIGRSADAIQAELQLFERNTLDEIVAFDLLRADPRPSLPGFGLVEQSDQFEIYINDAKLELRQDRSGAQLTLDAVPIEGSEADLVQWLVRALRRNTLTDSTLRHWVASLVGHLHREQGIQLTGLLRARHTLVSAALRRLDGLETRARKQGFEQLILALPATHAPSADTWATGCSPDWQFRYLPGRYPARHVYSGRWQFQKHYFEVIHDLKAQGEEFACAVAVDALAEVRHWVRNIERLEQFSFWLPTASDYFYPDFVAELIDGRLLVVEYKGDFGASADDAREKRAIGQAWARASAGQGLFVMVEKLLDGLDMAAQLRRALTARQAAGGPDVVA